MFKPLFSCLVVGLALMAGAPCAQARPPVVVEIFTSTNCPSCPAAEHKLESIAKERGDVLMVTQHVDYWNKGAARPDPHSDAAFTERQYDYSNRLSARPGQVFTPQPILDGQWVASPPLWFNWNDTLRTALAAPAKMELGLTASAEGDVTVRMPQKLDGDYEIVVFGLVKDELRPALWRATSVNVLPLKGQDLRLGKGNLPKGEKMLVLLQETGAGAVRGMALMQL